MTAHGVSWILVRQGREVTLFASGDSQTATALVPMSGAALRLQGATAHYIRMLELVRFQAIKETEYTVITKEGKGEEAVRTFKKIYLGRLLIKSLIISSRRSPPTPLDSISLFQRLVCLIRSLVLGVPLRDFSRVVRGEISILI